MKNSYKLIAAMGALFVAQTSFAALPGVDCLQHQKKNTIELQCFSGRYFYPEWLLELEASKREVGNIAAKMKKGVVSDQEKEYLKAAFATSHARYKEKEKIFFKHKDTYSQYYNGNSGEEEFIREALKIQKEFHHFTSQIQKSLIAPQEEVYISKPKPTKAANQWFFDRHNKTQKAPTTHTYQTNRTAGLIQPQTMNYTSYAQPKTYTQTASPTLEQKLADIVRRHKDGQITEKGFIIEVQNLLT